MSAFERVLSLRGMGRLARRLTWCTCAVVAAALPLALSPAALAQSTCQSPVPVPALPTFSGTNASAPSNDGFSACVSTTGAVWYSFTPTATGNHTIALCGSTINAVASLYAACDQPALACDNDTCGDDPVLVYPLIAGTPYLLRIASFTGSPAGAFKVTINGPGVSPINDFCGTPRQLPLNTALSAFNAGSTGTDTSLCGDSDTSDVWFSIPASIPGRYIIQVCSDAMQPVVSLHANCFGSPSTACNAGASLAPCAGGQSATAALSFNQTSAGTVLVRVAGVRGSFGDFTITAHSPRPNDLCSNATPIVAGTNVQGTITPALTTEASILCGPSSLDVWYSFTPTATGAYTIGLCSGASFDAVLSVHSGCPEQSGSMLFCSDDVCGTSPSLTTLMNAGQARWIRVAGKGNAGAVFGDFTLRADLLAPTNDQCADAITITEGAPITGFNAGATGVDLTPCANQDTKDVWYAFTPTASATYEMHTCGSSLATSLSLFDSCSGAPLACDDNNIAFCSSTSRGGMIQAPLTGGVRYLLRVAGLNQSEGMFNLAVARVAGIGENCSTPAPLTAGVPRNATLTGAAGSGVASCATPDGPDVWFSFTPSLTRHYRFKTCQSVAVTALSVYSACPPAAPIACGGVDSTVCPTALGPGSSVTAPLTAGQSYLLRVQRVSQATGGAVQVVVEAAPPVGDACQDAQPLPLDTLVQGANFDALTDGVSGCATDSGDVWYSLTPALTGWYDVSTCEDALPGAGQLNTVLSVHPGCGQASIACSDNNRNCTLGRSLVTVRLMGGQTYLVRVAGLGSARGVFALRARLVAPPNDTCDSATPVAEGDFDFDTQNATTDNAVIDASCTMGFNLLVSDVWFRYTPPAGGQATVTTCGSTWDTAITVSGPNCPLGLYTVIACNDDALCVSGASAPQPQSRVTFPVRAGSSYLIRIGSRFGIAAPGVLKISRLSTCRCDWDANDHIDVSDIFAFLGSWFARETRADFDNNGAVEVSDIFAFLSCWFVPCSPTP